MLVTFFCEATGDEEHGNFTDLGKAVAFLASFWRRIATVEPHEVKASWGNMVVLYDGEKFSGKTGVQQIRI